MVIQIWAVGPFLLFLNKLMPKLRIGYFVPNHKVYALANLDLLHQAHINSAPSSRNTNMKLKPVRQLAPLGTKAPPSCLCPTLSYKPLEISGLSISCAGQQEQQ